jgi:hypothetical protein
MTETNLPAGSGKNIRTLLVSALFMSIVAGAFVMPAMAISEERCMDRCWGPHSPDPGNPLYWSCHMDCVQHSSPDLVGPEPLPPCCTYGPLGEPYCLGLGKCTMDPVVGTTS